jgi:hypothetical protein
VSRAPALCPYAGLAPYTREEAAYFFGRERESQLVVANMRASSLCILYGASGVGKSSVLMAGAMPELEKYPRTAVVIYREWQHENLTDCVRSATIAALAGARARQGGGGPKLDDYGRRAATGVAPPLDELLAEACAALEGKLCVVFDQFEEYALYHAASIDPASFDAQLARAVNREDIPVSILISLREDQLASLDRFRARIPNLFTNTIRLEAMDEAATRLAIAKPLEVYCAAYPRDPVSIEPALVSDVINQVTTGRVRIDSHGSGVAQADERRGRVEAPFLQLVMTRLWREEAVRGSPVLQAKTLAGLGGATGIVKGHLDSVLGGLSDAQRELCSRFFDRLVTPSGSKVAYRIDDLAATAEASREEVSAVIAQLTGERRVLRHIAAIPGEWGSERVEIFHDVLAAAVLDWQRRFGEVRRQASVRLDAIRRATRIAVPIVVGLIVLAGVALVGAYLAEKRAGEAKVAERDAAAKRDSAVDEARAAEQQRDQAKAELNEATGALASIRNTTNELLQFAQKENAQREVAVAEKAIRDIDQALRPRVYLHGFTSDQEQAKEVAGAIEKMTGFAVPGFELVKEGPAQTELRYFRPEDEKFARKALEAIEAAGVQPVLKFVRGRPGSTAIRTGQLELWFGRPNRRPTY